MPVGTARAVMQGATMVAGSEGPPTVVAPWFGVTVGSASSLSATIGGQAGELLVALALMPNERHVSLPTGWSFLTDEFDHDGNAAMNGRWLYRQLSGALASETFSWTGGSGDDQMVMGVRITGHNAGSPFDPVNSHAENLAEVSQAPTSPDLTTTVPNCRILRAFLWDNGATAVTQDAGYPPGTTGLLVRRNTGVSLWMGMAHEERRTPGPVGTADWGPYPSTNRRNIGLTVAVRA